MRSALLRTCVSRDNANEEEERGWLGKGKQSEDIDRDRCLDLSVDVLFRSGRLRVMFCS